MIVFVLLMFGFLALVVISTLRIRVMNELDEVENSAGITQTSSYTIDGEQ